MKSLTASAATASSTSGNLAKASIRLDAGRLLEEFHSPTGAFGEVSRNLASNAERLERTAQWDLQDMRITPAPNPSAASSGHSRATPHLPKIALASQKQIALGQAAA